MGDIVYEGRIWPNSRVVIDAETVTVNIGSYIVSEERCRLERGRRYLDRFFDPYFLFGSGSDEDAAEDAAGMYEVVKWYAMTNLVPGLKWSEKKEDQDLIWTLDEGWLFATRIGGSPDFPTYEGYVTRKLEEGYAMPYAIVSQ